MTSWVAKNLSNRATEAYTGPSMFNASKPPASRYSSEFWRQSRALWATDLSNNATNETNASKPATLGYTGELWRQGVGHVLLSKSAHGGWCSTVLEIKLTVVRQVRPPEEGAVRRPSTPGSEVNSPGPKPSSSCCGQVRLDPSLVPAFGWNKVGK